MTDGTPSNVLFVVLDTVRKDRIGPYGYERETTPHLSTFADEATVFDTAVAPAPWTLPVHASMFTGLYPSQHGADQESPYLEGVQPLAASLLEAGYDTAGYSSNAWITPYTNLTDGFQSSDTFFEAMPGNVLSGPLASLWKRVNDSDRLRSVANNLVRWGAHAHEYLASGDGADTKTPAVIDKTRNFIRESDSEEGWFAFINLMDAHLPYFPPDTYREEYAPGVDPANVCQHSKEYNSGAREIDDDEWADIENLYDAEIAHMDAELGRLFSWLRETDRWDDTTVVVAADHGELHGEHDLYGHEFALYEELINVPLLIKHPELDTNRRTELVELVDLYHTVLDAVDLNPSTGEPSSAERIVGLDRTRSLLAEEYRDFDRIDGEPDPGQRAADDAAYAFVEYAQPVIELHHLEEKAAAAGLEIPEDHRARARLRAARGSRGKFIRADRISDEGFDLDRDPDEQTPLSPVEDDVIADAEAALARFEDAIGGAWTEGTEGSADLLDDADEEMRERLQDLGYLE